VCPYCRCPLQEGEPQTVCPGCDTPHHSDCFEENGGCTVFGCSHAPSDEPPVHVSVGELSSTPTATPAAVAVAPMPAPPPPPFIGSSAPPPPALPGTAMLSSTAPPAVSLAEAYAGVQARKSRTSFVLLAVFLGAFGVHNFYAGYYRKAAAQLCLSIFTCFYAAIVSEIWAIVEACIITVDGDGQEFS
jgi:TM2 domain-containing membrane protein YozV